MRSFFFALISSLNFLISSRLDETDEEDVELELDEVEELDEEEDEDELEDDSCAKTVAGTVNNAKDNTAI